LKYNNPIIRGFYPDPSICLFKGRYYLVNSSFEYFPGIPIFVSDDLVNWKQIGHVFDRDSQLNLNNSDTSQGLFAPTIRTDGINLYVIVTNVSVGENVYVVTDNPEGDWSDPICAQGWGGIDPSLFFDDDGKAYIQGTNDFQRNEKSGIYQAQIDLETGNLLSPRVLISEGLGIKSPESPHIFKHGTYYYLTLAEGGTEYGHMATIFRSKDINGPYAAYEHNPILTNRSTANEVQCAGHADLFQDKQNNWWLVALGIRALNDKEHVFYHYIGRETFLAPVEWSKSWPTVNHNGQMDLKMNGPLEQPQETIDRNLKIDCGKISELSQRFVYIRKPIRENYQLIPDKGLLLTGSHDSLDTSRNMTFIGLRPSENSVKYSVSFAANSNNHLNFGITAFMSRKYHYDLFVDTAEAKIKMRVHVGSIEQVVKEIPISGNHEITLIIETDPKKISFYAISDKTKTFLGSYECILISTEVAGTFTGVMLGIFAQTTTTDIEKVLVKNIDYIEKVDDFIINV